MITILYICTDDTEIYGSTKSLINLIHSTNNQIQPIVLLNGHGAVEDEFHRLGIETIISPFFCFWTRPKKIITALHHPTHTALYKKISLTHKCCRSVKIALHGRKIDIVHTNTSVTDIGFILAKRLRSKHVWHIRESLRQMGINPVGGIKFLEKEIACSEQIILISNALFSEWNFPIQKTTMIHDAVLLNETQFSNNQRSKNILFCAGEISEYKGASKAIEIFAKANLIDYHLILVGHCNDDYKNQLFTIARRNHIENLIVFNGYAANIAELFQCASACLICSQFEGLGRVSIEAMAYGCPVVALASSGGTCDIIQHGKTGYLFKNDEDGAIMLQKAIAIDSNIQTNAFNYVMKEFTEHSYGTQIMEIYNKLIK